MRRCDPRPARHQTSRNVPEPLLRCQRTVGPLAEKLGLEPEHDERLIEVDYGDWTGRPVLFALPADSASEDNVVVLVQAKTDRRILSAASWLRRRAR